MSHNHSHDHDHDVKVLTTREVLRAWLTRKLGVTTKRPVQAHVEHVPGPPADREVNTVAIILDGQVQEVIRAENRMTALLLSNPEFVVVNDVTPTPTIGWEYSNGEFFSPT